MPIGEPSVRTQPYHVLDLGTTLRIRPGLDLDIENLANTRYVEIRSSGFVTPGSPQALRMQLRWSWSATERRIARRARPAPARAGLRRRRRGCRCASGRASPFKSPLVTGFTLTRQERRALLAFLSALTDSAFITDPRFANPWPRSAR
ncbi:MAG: hypothetical protein AB7R55_22470 [Gemmatimonadales bacterium]